MIKLLPLLLALLGLYVMTRFSAWQMARQLRAKSRVLKHDTLERLIDRIAVEAGIDRIAVRVLEEPTVNGLVTPSGDIYVTSGLIQHYQRGRLSG
ncbi:MAG: peptidase M48, partial [Pseudomonadota bacterium]